MEKEKEERRILVHVCCGPCATSSIQRLLDEGWSPVLFFSDSNIWPLEEFEKRYENLLKVAAFYNLPVIKDEYDHQSWREWIKGFEEEPEHGKRCSRCFRYNLLRASKKAEELGIRAVVSAEEAQQALDLLSDDFEPITSDWKLRYQMNLDLLKKGTIADIARIVRCLYNRSKVKELPILERKLYDSAKQLLIDEISLSMKKNEKEIESAVHTKLEPPGAAPKVKRVIEDLDDEDDDLMSDMDSDASPRRAADDDDSDDDEDSADDGGDDFDDSDDF